ncbi:hypothetical protein F5I97DRAFT_1952052 [Phlebopus sp. FC_14]|nr:hypothetical protein F5I97DRAFT_1952052 [Phlebopus sp. FC_14]
MSSGCKLPSRALRPTEIVIQYGTALVISETKLTGQVRQLDRHGLVHRGVFGAACHVLKELGPCASDFVWRRAIKQLASLSSLSDHEDDEGSLLKETNEINELVSNWVFLMPNIDASSRGFNVTPKFAKLVEVLKACETYGDKFRGIIFVQRNAVATVMTDILKTLTDDLHFLRPFALIGSLAVADAHRQHEIYQNFCTGKYNLLIATRSLEDLDLPPSPLVVRYDMFESQLSYAYACARTIKPLGRVIHMVEHGNDIHRRILAQYTGENLDDTWIEVVMNDGAIPIPPKPLAETCRPFRPEDDEEMGSEPYIEDPTNSGRLYEQDAVAALYRLTANIYTSSWSLHRRPLFAMKEGTGRHKILEWTCAVMLPPGLPFDTITGQPRLTPVHARRAAAYEACMLLFEHGAFDHRLFPVQQQPIGVGRDVHTPPADKVSGNRCYPRKRTQFWVNSLRFSGHRLFPVVVQVKGPEKYAPILLLTRRPLPHIMSFHLFFDGVSGVVQNFRGAPVVVDSERVHSLHLFSLRICRAISNKPFACPVDSMSYMVAPLRFPEDGNPHSMDFNRLLDYVLWDTVSLAGTAWAVRFNLQQLPSSKDVEDVVIQDRWVEFTRRYYALDLRGDLTPLSKPEDSPREAGYANFVDYCKARRKGFEGLHDYDQPLIEVSKVAGVTSHLNPIIKPFTEHTKTAAKYLIPELSARFTVPASTLRTALLLPSITRRIEDFLIVQELNAKLFNHSIHEELLLAAISAPSAGFETDYERLELFGLYAPSCAPSWLIFNTGDSFLKYLASVYVFVTYPALHEGPLHAARQRIISNKVLMQSADRTGLPQYIQGKPFSYKSWSPPNFTIDPSSAASTTEFRDGGDETLTPYEYHESSSHLDLPISVPQPTELPTDSQRKKKGSRDDNVTQWLGDKTIADVAEAIIGAAYLSKGRDNALQAAKALQLPIPRAEEWRDFRRNVLVPPSNITAPLREGAREAVEEIIGHKFHHPHLLAQALTHASIEGYDAACYERLEFLGDAILDFMVVRYIFSRDERLSPGAMTMLKGAMVSNSTLAAVCVLSGLHSYLHFESHALACALESYTRQLDSRRLRESGVAAHEQRDPGQYWLDLEPPKVLSDIVESVIGAIYVSDGFTSDGAEAFYNKVLKPFYDRNITLKTLSHHPTKILFELLQTHGCRQFELVKERCDSTEETRCDEILKPVTPVVIHEINLASATAATAHAAGRVASMSALDALEGDPDFMSRACDCRGGSHKRRKISVESMLAVEMGEEAGSVSGSNG